MTEHAGEGGEAGQNTNESGEAGETADEGAIIVDGDERSAIAAIGDAERFLGAVEQQNAVAAADELMWMSFLPNQIVGASTGAPIVQEALSVVDGSTAIASCDRMGCAYTNYPLPRTNEFQLCTGELLRSADGTVTVDVSLNLSPFTARQETHLTASLHATSTLLEGWMQITGRAVGGTTVDTLLFNQVTLNEPPTGGSIQVDRTGPLGHYRTSFAFP